MDERSSKEKILTRIRKALLQKGEPAFNPRLDLDSDVYTLEDGESIEIFAANFIANNGLFTYCYNEFHFRDELLSTLDKLGLQKLSCTEQPIRLIMEACDFPVNTKLGDIKVADAALTGCDCLIARTGSVIVSSKGNNSRTVSIFPPVHLVIAWRDQIFYDLKNYFSTLKLNDLTALPSMISITSGPSRTADIEKTLVLGAHGPKMMHVFFIDQEKPY
jgi:L-lactate dehydrogenase complex protein LldG